MSTGRFAQALALLRGVFLRVGASLRARAGFWLMTAVMVLVAALGLKAVDQPAEAWINLHQSERWLPLARAASRYGELQWAPLLGILLLAICGWVWRDRNLLGAAFAAALAGVTAGLVADVLKWVLGRARPSALAGDGFHFFHGGYDFESFPSGHATHTMAIVAAVAVLAPRSAAAFFIGSAIVIWSRWYLERHYPTDLWAGAWLGLGIGLIFGRAVRDELLNKFSTAVPARGETPTT